MSNPNIAEKLSRDYTEDISNHQKNYLSEKKISYRIRAKANS